MLLTVILAGLGLLSFGVGALATLAGILPRFGGHAEPVALPIGIGFMALGLWLIFQAGGV
jgi:hypothetical protein